MKENSKRIHPHSLTKLRSEYDCFLLSVGGHLFDAIMFDVDNKDSTLGMSCPPAAFVESSILQKVLSLLNSRGTVFLIVCFPPASMFSMNNLLFNGVICLKYVSSHLFYFYPCHWTRCIHTEPCVSRLGLEEEHLGARERRVSHHPLQKDRRRGQRSPSVLSRRK